MKIDTPSQKNEVKERSTTGFLVICLMLLVTQVAQGQVLYGTMVGRIEDPGGAVMPGAKVTVINRATAITMISRSITSRTINP